MDNTTAIANVPAELEVIAALINAPEIIDTLGLHAGDFCDVGCRETFETISTLVDKGEIVDVFTIAEHLPPKGMVMAAGGVTWLGDVVMNAVGSTRNALRYAQFVKTAAESRRLASASVKIHEVAQSRVIDPATKSAMADEILAEAAASAQATGIQTKHVRSALEDFVTTLQSRESGELPGMTTGVDDLDRLTNGLKTHELVIVGARPSMGKTSFALGVAEAVARQEKCIYGGQSGVVIFSQEMPTGQLMDRMVSSAGSLPLDRLIRGALSEEDYTRLGCALGRLCDLPIWIYDKGGLTLGEIRARLRERRKDNIRAIVVDYLQLMQGPGSSRTEQIGNISRGLKQIAKDFGVAVIALSQLSRKLEDRADKRPMPSDLRDSGEIEQDADLILFVYRDEVYHPDSEDRGIAELIVGKNRNGPLGVVRTRFTNEFARFDPIAKPF